MSNKSQEDGMMVGVGGRLPLNYRKILRPIGKVDIDIELCKGCHYCVEFCPNKVLIPSGRVNKQGYEYPIVDPNKERDCVACGMCEKICPDYCIRVEDYIYVPFVG